MQIADITDVILEPLATEVGRPHSKTVCFINNKGGVGKTSIACGVAHTLSTMDRRVLVLDLDTQCNTTQIMLRNEEFENKASIRNVLDGSISVQFCVCSTRFPNLFVIPGSRALATLEPQLILDVPNSLLTLREKTREFFSQYFEWIIVDCPPNMGIFVLLALCASDYMVCPVNVKSRFSLQGLLEAIALAKKVKQMQPDSLQEIRVVANFVDRRTVASKETLVALRDNPAFSKMLFNSTIPQSSLFSSAESQKKIVTEISKTTPPVQAIQSLVAELIALATP